MMCFHKHKITNGQFVVDATTLIFLSYYIKIVTKELIYSENWHVHKDCYKTLLSIVFSVGALNSAPTEQDATSSATAQDGQASKSTSEVTAAATSQFLHTCTAIAVLQWTPE